MEIPGTRWKLLGELWALIRQSKYSRHQGLVDRAKPECWEFAASAVRSRAPSQSRDCYQLATGLANSRHLPTRGVVPMGAEVKLVTSVLITIPSDHRYSE